MLFSNLSSIKKLHRLAGGEKIKILPDDLGVNSFATLGLRISLFDLQMCLHRFKSIAL